VSRMLNLFESLPLPATTLIVATLAVLVVALVVRVMPSWFAWASALIVPFVLAYAIYWAPILIYRRTNVADYSAWEFVVVGAWGVAGTVGSLVCVYLLKMRHKSKH
jgi:hypothetical protein